MNKELKIRQLLEYIKIPNLTKEQKKEFSKNYNKQAVILFRITLLIIFIAIIPYFFLDYYRAPQTYKFVWLIRFSFYFPLVIIGLWLSYKPIIIKYFQIISNTINILLNISILLMILIVKPQEPAYESYYVGLLVIISVVISMKIRLLPSLINFSIITILYFLIAFFHQNLTNSVILNNLFFILSTILAMITANFLLEIYSRKNFLQEKLLQQKAKDLQQKNEKINHINQQLSSQNDEILTQRDEIEAQRDSVTKQKEIIERIHLQLTESIDYATRIQQAILPEEEILAKYVSQYFVLYKPKDKVSGDFYWWSHVKNYTIIIAADCTGHGVPGAFMSMLGTSFLREIIEKEYITNTSLILKKLRKEIIRALKQKGKIGEQTDGMDMAIVRIEHKTNIIQFSGANNPLYIISTKSIKDLKPMIDYGALGLYEIKPNKMPIAIYQKMDNFTTHQLHLQKGDQLYLFSDGYADQFGGKNGRKLKYKPFKKLLLENANKSMSEQKRLLNTYYENWKGSLDQIDDILVLGIKI